MTAPSGVPPGILEYFIAEATEYIDRLDNLLTSAGAAGPDADSFGRYARALRGSATMSKQYGIAELAAGLERMARAFRNRVLHWNPGTSTVAVGAVDDLRILLHHLRAWGPEDDRRAQLRTAELERLAPSIGTRPTPLPATPAADTPAAGTTFLVGETAELARALDQLLSTPDDPGVMAGVGDRVRSLRGVAGLRELAPLPEVLDAVEHTLKTVELSTPAGVSGKQRALFSSAAVVLRRASRDIATRGRPAPGMPDLIPFNSAVVALSDESGRADRIVPIAQLFYDDAGPHIVSAAAQPPTTAAQRFRMEVVSLAEHLRSVVAEARARRGPEHREHMLRELRASLRALGSAANSFGEKQVARFAAEWSVKVATVNDAQLTALDRAATLLANPSTRADELVRGLELLAAPRSGYTPRTPAVPITPPRAQEPAPAAPPTVPPAPRVPPAAPGAPLAPTPASFFPPAATAPPAAPMAPRRASQVTPTGRELREMLQSGIAGLTRLEEQPLSLPAPLDDEIVPIEHLLYRGRAALLRATQLRDEIKATGGSPSREAVQELFDLLDLALTE